jgi:hypothetical protein
MCGGRTCSLFLKSIEQDLHICTEREVAIVEQDLIVVKWEINALFYTWFELCF